MGAIHLVRHGQASFAAEDYDQLSPLGYEQARLLGGWMKECGSSVDVVVTGGMRRHQQTALACLEESVPVPRSEWIINTGFDEFDHIEVLLRHRPEFGDRKVLERFLEESGNSHKAFQTVFASAVDAWLRCENEGEYNLSWRGFCARSRRALEMIIESAGPSQQIWVFTSGGVITTILQDLLAIPPERAMGANWTLVNAGVTKLLYRPGQISLSTFNTYSHLERLRRPELITYR